MKDPDISEFDDKRVLVTGGTIPTIRERGIKL
jgi:hypothetical protein